MSEGSLFAALDMQGADMQPLSPVHFIQRVAYVFSTKTAIAYGARRITYGEFGQRCKKLAAALIGSGIKPQTTVSVLCPNVPEMLELHFAVPMTGAVLNTINTRLDAKTIATILDHGESQMLFVDREYADVAEAALSLCGRKIRVIGIDDPAIEAGRMIGDTDYESFLASGLETTPLFDLQDETMPISLSYTSGTTGNPKGVVYSHRGAALNALGNVLAMGLSTSSTYLWTLPLFHCNGWTHPWAVTAVGGTHVCLRAIDPAEVFRLIEAENVTHMAAAPIVLSLLIHAPDEAKPKTAKEVPVQVATGGAAPPSKVIDDMETMGFKITHLYGLTESYGPSLICEMQADWEEMTLAARAQKMARQGVPHVLAGDYQVVDPQTMQPVPADGKTIGEIMLRGNTVMKGYLKNPEDTAKASAGGWFHSGDLAVLHPDGYAEVKDRSKDIIISGGENISSLEVEEALYQHPDIMEAAVVARPDDKWGETPCAFITLKPGAAEPDMDSLRAFCRQHLASYKLPSHFVFSALPKTQTGKIQKTVLREQAKAVK
ncbi:MAG: AMP-binding protein [Proteobacteria bacterium]|jgi:fatty-acyl-CoA synthase|nr:AMP-binding protein [Pseudomonadota bacterium]MDA0959863.1 AMP-binding protein [Pseudomonadota bacterium]MDA1151093.1 AMP-binding protein [Pseudomonadota bacterium]